MAQTRGPQVSGRALSGREQAAGTATVGAVTNPGGKTMHDSLTYQGVRVPFFLAIFSNQEMS